MPDFKILFIGGSNLELVTNMYKLPGEGEEIIDDGGVAYVPGGGAAMAAVSAVKLGAVSLLSTNLGRDSHGKQLFGFYKDKGVDTSLIKVDKELPSGFTLVIKESGALPRRVSYPGANLALTPEMVCEAISTSPDAVYISLDVPFATAKAAADAAGARGIPVIMDASPASHDYPLESLPKIEIFTLDAEEMLEYTGELPGGASMCLRAALSIAKRVNFKYLVIKQGERGSFLYDGKHYQMEAALHAGKTEDTSGVGDVFTSALAIEYVRSKGDITTAIKYATAAAAISVTRFGAASSAPADDEVMDLYNSSYT